MTDTVSGWESLSRGHRDRVLEKLLARRAQSLAQGGAAPLTRADPAQPVPASLEQQWFLERAQIFGGRLAMTIGVPPLILDKVNGDAVEAALEALQDWHPVLHTRIVQKEGQFWQVADRMQTVPFERVTLPATAIVTGAEAFVRDRFAALNARAFDPESGPLWRAELIRRGSKGVLLLSFSSLIADGDAAYMMRDAFCHFYEGFARGDDPEAAMEPVALDYHDYAAWQAAQARSGAWASSLAWWQQHLSGGPPAYWNDGRAGAAPSRLYEQVIGPATGARLDAYAKAKGTTPYTVMLTEFMALLADLDGGQDIWVTQPSALRVVPGTQTMTGTFARQVLLRLTLPQDSDPLTAVQDMLAETLDHDRVPHLLVHRMLEKASAGSVLPYRYVFNYRQIGADTPQDQRQDHPFRSEPVQQEAEREEDILLMVMQSGEARLVHWYLRTDRFPPPRAGRIMESFLTRLTRRIG